MNKSELINAVAKKTDLSRKDTEKAISAAIELAVEALKQGKKVQIVGFGSFQVKERAARIARNPRTGKEIAIGPSKSPAFKAGKALKEDINA